MDSNETNSEKDLERLLHTFASSAEAQLPNSDEEIAAFFQSLDVSSVPTPNVERFKGFLSRELHPKIELKSPKKIFEDLLAQGASAPWGEGGLVPARKGKKITPKTRLQMDKAKRKRPE